MKIFSDKERQSALENNLLTDRRKSLNIAIFFETNFRIIYVLSYIRANGTRYFGGVVFSTDILCNLVFELN
jgi:hypothetical protein